MRHKAFRDLIRDFRWTIHSDGKDQAEHTHPCGCIGPQNGDPLCPCRMRNLTIQNGRYVEIIDHGPVSVT